MFPQLSRLRAALIISAVLFGGAGLCEAALITSELHVTGTIGSPFEYQITADNQPTSFDATNLAPGLSLDRVTGLISGVPNISGGAYTEVTAHGQGGDAVATVDFTMYVPFPPNDPRSGSINVECISLLADPNRPRLYCGGAYEELVVIDTDTRSIVTRFPNTGYITHQSISPDGHTLWLTRINALARVNLDTLDGFVPLPSPGSTGDVRQGLDNRLYVSYGFEVLQRDASTGAIQERFTPNDIRPTGNVCLAISPDRRTLYVSDAFYVGDDVTLAVHGAISRYDISTATPTLLQRVDVTNSGFQGLTMAPDGDSIYATYPSYFGTHINQTLCIATQDLSITKGAFSFHGGPTVPVTITADGALALQPATLGTGGELITGLVYIFDTRSFQLLKTVVLGTATNVYPGDAFLDRAGSQMFVAYGSLRIYTVEFPPPPVTPPKSLLNISTRMLTQNGDNVLIGGFIVTGTDPKQVILRGIGPSLPVSGYLSDPVLELHRSNGTVMAENDNWNSHRDDVLGTGIPPPEEREAAIVTILLPGTYTAVLHDAAGSAGIAAMEVYDLNATANSRLANISTRGKVETGDNVMIGGWIIGGGESTSAVVRAIGPSLAGNGVAGALTDPTLAVHNGNGTLLAQDDDWRTSQEQALIASGLAPTDDRESAILLSLPPGPYTAVVAGKNNATGVALVEIYNLQ